jgi:hypothetical protein
MTGELVEEVRSTWSSMSECAASHLMESESQDLRCIVRLSVEFFYFLQRAGSNPVERDELNYVCESVFSGVDSFCSVTAAYRTFAGVTRSEFARDMKSGDSLRAEFISKYHEFADGMEFGKRCGLLLDLFKLQIVFAGMSYE